MSFGGVKVTMAQLSHPALVGVVIGVLWFIAIAAVPDDGGTAERTGRSLAAGGLSVNDEHRLFRVFLDPAGSDTNNGLTPGTAVRSLAAAQKIITAARPDTDAEIRIKKGTYVAPPVKWTTYVPGRTITFLPLDYDLGEDGKGISGRPLFRGDRSSGFWFTAALPSGRQQRDGTRLRFYFLQVESYAGGAITFDGGTVVDQRNMVAPASAGLNGNTIYGMVFRELGSKHANSGTGFGGIDLVNSRNNIIQENRFEFLENIGSTAKQALVHGVYLSHHSSGNVIKGNHFYGISGDPIRIRDDSNRNKVFDNTFRKSGSNAYFSDWFVDGKRDTKAPLECTSHGNVFYSNRLISGYHGKIDVWWAAQPSGSDAGRGCGDDGDERVRMWGNRLR